MGFIIKTIITLGMMFAGVEAQSCYTNQAQTFKAGEVMCYGGKTYICKDYPYTQNCTNKYFNPSFVYADQAWTATGNNCPIVCDNACMFIYKGAEYDNAAASFDTYYTANVCSAKGQT